MAEEQHRVKIRPINSTAECGIEIQAVCSCGVLVAQAAELDSYNLMELIGNHSIDVMLDVATASLQEGLTVIGKQLKDLAKERKKAHPPKPPKPKDKESTKASQPKR